MAKNLLFSVKSDIQNLLAWPWLKSPHCRTVTKQVWFYFSRATTGPGCAYPKNPYLNQATQKHAPPNFPCQKSLETQKKSFDHPTHLNSGVSFLGIRSFGDIEKLTSFPRDHTFSALLYI